MLLKTISQQIKTVKAVKQVTAVFVINNKNKNNI